MIKEVHIGSKGVETTIPAGYVSRSMRRAYMKKHGMFKRMKLK